MIKRLVSYIQRKKSIRSSSNYIKFLRIKGIKIGTKTIFRDPSTTRIDLTRPSLIEIGDNVDINVNFTIQTHDYTSHVFLNLFNEFVASSGRVKIGNNIYFGCNVTILKGVIIGDNCIIGACSLVTKDIPENSVAVGFPAKVICTIEEFYIKRLNLSEKEAFHYAKSIVERYNRLPVVEDFWEEFPLFVNGENASDYPTLPIKNQLRNSYDYWIKNHISKYNGFSDFLFHAGIKKK